MKLPETVAEVQRRTQVHTGKRLDSKTVRAILDLYHGYLQEELAEGRSINIYGVCSVFPGPEKAPWRVRVREAAELERMLKQEKKVTKKGMEKYGVSTQPQTEDGEKIASEEPKYCPICRSPVEVRDGQYFCPQHGTAPFERR